VHPRSETRPTQAQLIFPLLDTLSQMGGRGTPMEVADALAERFGLDASERSAETRTSGGQRVNMWQRHVRFARQKAKDMGYLDTEQRGTWRLSELGAKGLQHAQPAIVVEIDTYADGSIRCARVDLCIGVPTTHMLVHGDARNLDFIPDGAVPLIVTSPPYFDLKRYERGGRAQLGDITAYDEFLAAMEDVLRECLRILMPGGRACINVGEILRSRSRHGEHHVLPLPADLQVRARAIGFRNLTPIHWYKKTNCAYEQGGSGILGTPGQPNGLVKAEVEQILLLRKPGPYRSVSRAQQRDSFIDKQRYATYFRQVWDDVSGARTDKGHPAPFPIEIAERLVRMYSFTNDIVVDPFAGSFTSSVAAAKAGRHSVGIDAAPRYVAMGLERLKRADIELARAS
jgi:DNA modification methylase